MLQVFFYQSNWQKSKTGKQVEKGVHSCMLLTNIYIGTVFMESVFIFYNCYSKNLGGFGQKLISHNSGGPESKIKAMLSLKPLGKDPLQPFLLASGSSLTLSDTCGSTTPIFTWHSWCVCVCF